MEQRKMWKLEVTSNELTILQIALQRLMDQYNGFVFTEKELLSTKAELQKYNYIYNED